MKLSTVRALVVGLTLLSAAPALAQISTTAWYTVVNGATGKCVDARGAATANGTAVQQYTCNSTFAQQWQLQATSGGYYRVNNRNNAAQVWDVAGVSTADGGLIHLWTYGGGNNQQWLPVAETSGDYHFVSRHSGRCLDVPSSSTADGVQLQQWACNGSAAQAFSLLPVGGPTPTATATATPTARPRPTPTVTPTSRPRATPTATAPPSGNLALGRPATASSTENTGTTANLAVDGNAGTRWSSAFSDPQWIYVDLGGSYSVTRVVLRWEAAFGRSYQIQASNDASTWTTLFSTTTGDGGVDDLAVSGTGRYVRMMGTARGTVYGYSLWELEVYSGGTPGPTPTATATSTVTPTPGGTPNFGPNVHIYDPTTPNLQTEINNIYNAQQPNHFGPRRDAILFLPGTYNNLRVPVGFYTQVLGLGSHPDQVHVNGEVRSNAFLSGDNATQNFWRGVENLSTTPSLGIGNNTMQWAVSQAIPFRRNHVRGNIKLNQNNGWASGGWFSDVLVDGEVNSATQQQWISRNTQWGSWIGSNWNMVFVGVPNPPAGNFPTVGQRYTKIAQTPIVREKPYLFVDANGAYAVRVPSLRTNSVGISWANGATTPGTTIPISQFFLARPVDSAATINTQLAAGRHILFTPGVYVLTQTIQVNSPNTVILGIGFPTLRVDNGQAVMRTADVDGLTISGLFFDAGTTNSPVLLEVGPNGSSASHAANPTVLHDLFFRVGGAAAGRATVNLSINSHNTIVDHTWIWRADHGTGVGWTANPSAHGLWVNGNNVTIYGLFVEHYQNYQVMWNGNGGRVYFYQSEIPYDPPNQTSWNSPTGLGFASYKVADSVTSHEAWGLGVYSVFSNANIFLERAIEAPVNTSVRFHSMISVCLGSNGGIIHVINNTGAQTGCNASVTPTVTSFP